MVIVKVERDNVFSGSKNQGFSATGLKDSVRGLRYKTDIFI